MPTVIPIRNQYMDKKFTGLYCQEPFITVHIETDGVVSLCPCPAWGKTQIGNILKTSLQDMLASALAQDIRQSIIDGTYRYCNENHCGIIGNNELVPKDLLPPKVAELITNSAQFAMPTSIRINGDRTCNLSCPSCRTSVVKLDDSAVTKQQAVGDVLYANLFSTPTDEPVHVSLSGSGEVFASAMLLGLLSKIKLSDFPNLRLELHTNALLSQRFWHKLEHLESAIMQVTVSVDAAQASTYQVVRRGGVWKDLLTNLTFLQDKKQQLNFKYCARMIVQQKNYLEMLEFYQLCKQFNIDRVEYSRLNNWGTWTSDQFKQEDVLGLQHPERNSAKALVALVKDLPNTWFEGNFE
jgi:wyosine [tRNA(Phe)-imidazoG37] synthetase (radical SAM superfamily)